jgi:SNF2 family DNA or RNA helicase
LGDALSKAKVPYAEYTGKVPQGERDQMVKDYNSGLIKQLLISGAGGEGLDLKGTKLMQILEPHWNEPTLDQVKGRAVRYQSHAHLPENERNVEIQI